MRWTHRQPHSRKQSREDIDLADLASTASRNRIQTIDLVRGAALVAMASYHFTWDLEIFGYLGPGTAGTGMFKWYARSIAGTFLLLAGVSLVLAQYPVLRRDGFLRRLGLVTGAAALITLATLIIFPDSFIFFGILHAIALFSVLGLAFVRLPVTVTLLVAAIVLALPQVYRSAVFDAPWLWWVGLSAAVPRSNDYVPLFPWFALVLAGIAVARIGLAAGAANRLARAEPMDNRIVGGLVFLGRHSLAVYLVHQPVLLAFVWAATLVVPPTSADPVAVHVQSCETSCRQSNGAEMCERFCGCVMDELLARNLFNDLQTGRIDPTSDSRVSEIAKTCTISSLEP